MRTTNYGAVFDVVAQKALPGGENLAYTALPLSCHTDNPYRDPCPGVQLLHCIRPATCAPPGSSSGSSSQQRAAGGLSLLVDGFEVAAAMRARDPAGFELLCRVPRPFIYRDPAGLTCLQTVSGRPTHARNRTRTDTRTRARLLPSRWFSRLVQLIPFFRCSPSRRSA